MDGVVLDGGGSLMREDGVVWCGIVCVWRMSECILDRAMRNRVDLPACIV